jgi:hypothetical protein
MPRLQDFLSGNPQRAWQRRANPICIALLHLAPESRTRLSGRMSHDRPVPTPALHRRSHLFEGGLSTRGRVSGTGILRPDGNTVQPSTPCSALSSAYVVSPSINSELGILLRTLTPAYPSRCRIRSGVGRAWGFVFLTIARGLVDSGMVRLLVTKCSAIRSPHNHVQSPTLWLVHKAPRGEGVNAFRL